MKKRVGAVILILVMVMSLIPAAVLADDTVPAGAEAVSEMPAAEEPEILIEEPAAPVAEESFAGSDEEPIAGPDEESAIMEDSSGIWQEEPSGDSLTAAVMAEGTDPTPIDLPTITLTPPYIGLTTWEVDAADYISLPEDAPYYLEGTPVWGRNTGTEQDPYIGGTYIGTFEEGKTYYIYLPQLTAKSGYYWDTPAYGLSSTTVIGGCYVGYKGITNGDNGIISYGPVIAFQPVPIPSGVSLGVKSIDLSFMKPVAGFSAAGMTAESKVLQGLQSNHCQIVEAKWYEEIPNADLSDDETDPKPVFTGTFEEGKTYYMRVVLSPKEGFRFLSGSDDEDEGTKLKVYGAESLYDTLRVSENSTGAGSGYGVVIVSVKPDVYIDLPTITFTPPFAGQSTNDVSAADCVTLPEGARYYLEDQPIWGKNTSFNQNPYIGGAYNGTFEEGKTYYLYLSKLTAETDCYWNTDFDGLSGMTVIGGQYVNHMTATYSGNGITTFSPVIAFTPQPVPTGVVTRLFGSNRYSTSLAIATQLKKENGGGKFSSIVLARGTEFPDALAGGYLANVKNAPIILIRDNKPVSHKDNQMVAKWIKANLKSGGTIYVLGSTAALPKSHVDLVKSGFKVKRLEGKNRFGTNAAILEAIGTNGIDEVIVTTGRSFPDALCASALDMPLLILDTTKTKELSKEQKAYLAKLKNPTFYVVGPASVIPATFETQLSDYGTVKRIATDKNAMNRSVQIAETLCPKPQGVALAVNDPYPDGLCGGVIANKHKAPLLLVKKGSEAKATAYAKARALYQGLVFGANKDTVVPNISVSKILPKAKIVHSEYK